MDEKIENNKIKKIKKQFLTTSVASMMLFSGVTGTGTALSYAAERDTTSQKHKESALTSYTYDSVNNEINNLYDGHGLLKSYVTQDTLDAIQKKIYSLNGQSVTLQNKLNSVQKLLQELQIKTTSGQIVAQLDVTPAEGNSINAFIKTFAATINSTNSPIGSIEVSRIVNGQEKILFQKDYVSGTYTSTNEKIPVDIKIGDKITITTHDIPLTVNKMINLPNKLSSRYTFKVDENKQLVPTYSDYDIVKKTVDSFFNGDSPRPFVAQSQISIARKNVESLPNSSEKENLLAKIQRLQEVNGQDAQLVEITGLMNNLFDGKVPRQGNTQNEITEAKRKIEKLPDNQEKVNLLSRIDYAQRVFDENSAVQAVNNLFNGDTPKDSNTQEQINEASKKVELLSNSAQKTDLLNKIKKAQTELDKLNKKKEAVQAVDNLFSGDTPKTNNTADMFNNAVNLVSTLSEEDAKPLKVKLSKAFLELSTYKQVINTTPYPSNNEKAGIMMGQGHDRQDLGIQIQKDATITIRQINPKFHGNLKLRLLTNDSRTESSIDFSQTNVTLKAIDLATPFIDTPYNQENGEKPTIEFSVNGQKLLLPKFNKQTSMDDFINTWNQTNGYALIQGDRFQTFLPNLNKNAALSMDLNKLIDLYDNDIIGFYNELIGLSDNDKNPLNCSSNRRYFYKADKHGAGALYYGGSWAAQTSDSASAWLSDGWGALHETGHGYQGKFMSRGMNTGEVWNNIYGVIYQYKKLGKQKADEQGWLYGGHKNAFEQTMINIINGNNPQYQTLDVRKQLFILSLMIDKAGDEGLKNFYIKYRKLANQPGFNADNHPLPNLLVSNLGEINKFDFSAILSSWGLNVSNDIKNQAKNNGFVPVAHLAQVVPENKLTEAVSKLTKNNRLSSALSLVTNEELKPLNLTSNVTLKFKDGNLFEGMKLRILDGNKLYKEITLGSDPVTINNMPNGVYSLELGTDTGYIQKPYLFVKDNGTVTISLNNYLKEATEAVDHLFQDNDHSKIKTNLMQKDIDQAKKKVTALPNSSQKDNLLTRLNNAFDQLQEFTFKGLGNFHFASFDVANGVATVRTIAGTPHSYFHDRYASITISRNNETIYQKEYIGDRHYDDSTDTINLNEGDIVTVTHREANDIRLTVNHNTLKNNTSGTYEYIVKNGQLMINYVGIATAAVNSLFQNQDQIKPTIMQKDIDDAKIKVNDVPDSQEKQRLLDKVDKAYNSLQEITFKGYCNNTFATLDVADSVATVRTNAVTPHTYFTNVYASISISRDGKDIYKQDYVGNKKYSAKVETINLQEGDIVTITHKEANDTRLVVNHRDLKNNTSGTYRYMVTNGKLILTK
ncbi:toxin Cry1Ac domain D-VI-related protein [Enterococcus sp. DIV0691]|uniref:toxin Cry1Ac domain D-VI-related protein n=1 Tax=Enterococcus sp. DIV0691 TaxID=2774703 RepID=UPI003F1F8CB8